MSLQVGGTRSFSGQRARTLGIQWRFDRDSNQAEELGQTTA
jgi:hypothetical protein